ncbi:MAG TPA: glucose 1-dehydrogenase [Nannocystis sp.]
MQALVVTPGQPDSARLAQMDEPSPDEGAVLVEMVAVGVCGTDREILHGDYGEGPGGEQALVLGHESLGRVLEAPAGSGLASGDLVVGMVRHPDPVPCVNCAVGEWDMCRNGQFTEHGIKGRHGFCRERFRLEPGRLIRVEPALGLRGVLLEPTSVVAKAWEHILRIGGRARFAPRRALITGGGPIGLLAALIAVQHGLEVHLLDHAQEGLKPALTRELGATYHGDPGELAGQTFDVIVECTGAPQLVLGVMSWSGPDGIVCLTGVSSGGRKLPVDLGDLARGIVLENTAIFGSVNANRRHYEQAATALARADQGWLGRLITRRVPMARWSEALERDKGDVKVVILGPGADGLT